MRTEAQWNEKVKLQYLQNLSPRIQKDLQTISTPNDLPELGSYFIYGKIRTGKTLWATWLYLEACKQKYLNATSDKIAFLKTSEFFNAIKKSYDNPESSEQKILDQYSEASFLVLDDFGSERPTDWVLSLLYLLVDRRYENLLPTVFTSNHSLEQIAVKFGDDRITSRIKRMCKIIHKTKF